MPLVLHGGTGIPTDMIKKAISLGVAKINVNTECQLAFQAATRKYIEEGNISSSSSVIIAVIRAVSRGCVMYGIEVPLRNIPLCACSANLAALVIIRYSFPSSFNDMDIYLAEWNLNSSLIK